MVPSLAPRRLAARASAARGQTLLLFCLTLLLLTVMVFITLSIATKVKDRIELQNVADAAAYSEAVVTARSFNAISLMNRTQVSHMVALSAVQSLISWSGYTKASMESAKQALIQMRADCADTDVNDAIAAINAEEARIKTLWDEMDNNAGTQQRTLQGIAAQYKGYELALYNDWSRAVIEGRGGRDSLAQKLAEEARKGSPWRNQQRELFVNKQVMSNAAYPSIQELGRAVDLDRESNHAVHITMGSRLDTFVTMRANGGAALQSMLSRLIGGNGFSSVVVNQGSGYYSNQSSGHSPTHGAKADTGGTWGWGDDHGSVTVVRNGTLNCPAQTENGPAPTGFLHGTDITSDDNDKHRWSPVWDMDEEPAYDRHTYGSCRICPGIWPGFIDYQEPNVADRDDIYAQPKNIVVVQRDLAARDSAPDPWQLNFNLEFTRGSGGSEIDLRKFNVAPPDKIQAALATGLVYYHRAGGNLTFDWEHWKEPPNFFNPFWRATLVGTDVDERGSSRGDSAITALQQHNLNTQARTMQLLRANGFKGWQ